MAIPANILSEAKELLRVRSADTSLDSILQTIYERVLDRLVREQDLLVERESINATIGQSIYSAQVSATRVITVLHDGVTLSRVASANLDFLREAWLLEGDRDPEWFTVDKIPPGLDSLSSITPERFAVVPAPGATLTGERGLIVYEGARPQSDDPVLTYLDPYLVFQTCGEFLTSGTDDRDPQTGQIFLTLADMCLQIVLERVPL